MLKRGTAPFYECSSQGDNRFSAFYARIIGRGDATIESIYQAAKVFEDGSTGLSWKEAKGKKPVNIEEVAALYDQLWLEYIAENPHLLITLQEKSGLSDMFGQEGHQCQADTLWRIARGELRQ